MKRGGFSASGASGFWKLWSLIRIEQPQILQTWMYHADLLGLLVVKLTRVPALFWNVRCAGMEMEYYPRLSRLVVPMLCLLSRIPEVVVVNSEAGRLSHARMGYRPKRFEVIPNGFDLDRFCVDARAREWFLDAFKLTQDTVIVGLVARYDPMKDHAMFLSAISKVHALHPSAYFVLCGTQVDETNHALVQRIKDYGLKQCVRLLGERDDIPKITAAFDIACSASSFGEGFSNAIGEAMASGVPCLVTDVGDSASIVGATGRVVPPRNAEVFAAALSELIGCDPVARKSLGAQARARIAEQFDINQIAARYKQLYLSFLSSPSNGSVGVANDRCNQ
jgi:glycosyltransferase involved in cell wall biosynthesis